MSNSSVTRACPVNRGVPLMTICSALVLAAALLLAPAAHSQDNPSLWSTWVSESFTLAPRESFQMRVEFKDMPLRRWKLVVEGGDNNCDLSVLRTNGEELLYYKTNESRHEVSIPWGQGEELMVVLTNRSHPAAFVVNLLGPPKGQATAAYSYHVNRALEAFASGLRLEAEEECRRALKADDGDGVAKVLYAGFERDRNFYDHAAILVEEALAGELPDEMHALAQNMRSDLVKLRAPLPGPVVKGLQEAEAALAKGDQAEAVAVCEKLLDGDLELDGPSESRLLTLKGRALEGLGRSYEAVDAFTQALNYDRSRDNQAVVYFYMGRLFYGMDNLAQAQGAFVISLQNGLPMGLDLQAREIMKDIDNRLKTER